jgi:hypothetical protein
MQSFFELLYAYTPPEIEPGIWPVLRLIMLDLNLLKMNSMNWQLKALGHHIILKLFSRLLMTFTLCRID